MRLLGAIVATGATATTVTTTTTAAVATVAAAAAMACVGDATDGTRTPARDDGAAPAASCAKRAGSFVSTYTEKVGTCGPLRTLAGTDTISESYTEQPTQPPLPCTGALRTSPDNCTTTIETSCPSVSAGAAYETRGTLTWDPASTAASGDVEVSTPSCKSTYHVEVRRP